MNNETSNKLIPLEIKLISNTLKFVSIILAILSVFVFIALSSADCSGFAGIGCSIVGMGALVVLIVSPVIFIISRSLLKFSKIAWYFLYAIFALLVLGFTFAMILSMFQITSIRYLILIFLSILVIVAPLYLMKLFYEKDDQKYKSFVILLWFVLIAAQLISQILIITAAFWIGLTGLYLLNKSKNYYFDE